MGVGQMILGSSTAWITATFTTTTPCLTSTVPISIGTA